MRRIRNFTGNFIVSFKSNIDFNFLLGGEII